MAVDWNRVLAGLGQGLMQAGQPGGNIGHIGIGAMQGAQAYDAGQDRQAEREFRKWQQEQAQLEAEAARTANADAEERRRLQAELLANIGGGGPMQTASAAPGAGPMQGGGVDPRIFQAFPELGAKFIEQQVFPDKPDAFKPDITEFFGEGNTKFKGYLDQSGNVVKVGESAPLYEPNEGPAPTETERLMRLAGIDPASPEGKQIIGNKLQGDKPSGPKPPTPKELRDEYVKANKDFEQAMFGYSKVVNAAKNPSPAGDIALIFGFMKTMDPGSTVREGEFATAQNAGSVPERVVALYNSVLQGTRLTGDQRKDFINQAGGQFKVYQDRKNVADQFYSGLAERSGVSPQDVLVPYGAVPQYTPDRGGPGDERNRGSRVIDGVRIERLE